MCQVTQDFYDCSSAVQVEISCSARLPSTSGRHMDSTPYFTAASLKFSVGSGAAPSGNQSALNEHVCVPVEMGPFICRLACLFKFSCRWCNSVNSISLRSIVDCQCVPKHSRAMLLQCASLLYRKTVALVFTVQAKLWTWHCGMYRARGRVVEYGERGKSGHQLPCSVRLRWLHAASPTRSSRESGV